jgi:hypothetical protein
VLLKKYFFLAAANPLTPGRYSSPQQLFAFVIPYLQPTAIKELQHMLIFFRIINTFAKPVRKMKKGKFFSNFWLLCIDDGFP